MRDLERLLQLCCESARVLCGHMESLSSDLYELGRNMGMLSKWEEAVRAQSGTYTEAGYSAAKRSVDCKQLSVASARQNAVWKTAAVKTAASLVSLHDCYILLVSLHDYYILIPEAVAALEERERCLEQIHDLEAELAQKQADLNKTTGSSKGPVGGRDRRAYTLTNSVERLDEQLKSCRDQYLVIKQRNMEELRRLNLSREQDFHAMMANFAIVQSQLMQSSADLWRNTARQFTGETGAGAAESGAAQAEDEALRDD
ncbi:Sorting nexin 2B [Tetrabaena socialis]|uniref:Sorting nexin 2B n=1 Tax=Tetrabaena socialis TaxID=47790 RepID=A0A2J8A3Y9_9CHLO|nr:Sorting nexin 2B [Tetrabaena socialis]|eukprot:PNH07240.1 Sorting nexin 2B [Tetrabaena socialis]